MSNMNIFLTQNKNKTTFYHQIYDLYKKLLLTARYKIISKYINFK